MKLDILVFAAHPDDAELSCSGTIASHVALGKKIGIVDITRGEMGTRGNVDLRAEEARSSSDILGVLVRENLGLPDGFFTLSQESFTKVARVIRKYRPEIVIANAIRDRHPDHGRAAKLVEEAIFYAGLQKIEILDSQEKLSPWRPKALYHYIQSEYIEPDLIVDVSAHWDKKLKSIWAFKSQFHDPDSTEPETYISKPGFIDFLESRCKMWGQAIGVEFGEGFTVNRKIGVNNLFDLI